MPDTAIFYGVGSDVVGPVGNAMTSVTTGLVSVAHIPSQLLGNCDNAWVGTMGELSTTLRRWADLYGKYSRLCIYDHSRGYTNSKGQIVEADLYIGKSKINNESIELYSGYFDAIAMCLTNDAVVKLENCYVASDRVLHASLAKRFKRPVIAGRNSTTLFGLYNGGGFVTMSPSGNPTVGTNWDK